MASTAVRNVKSQSSNFLSISLFILTRSLKELIQKKQIKSSNNIPLIQGLKLVFKNPQSWIIALYGMSMYMPLVVLGDLLGVSFLERLYGIEESYAATIVAALLIGIAIGSPFFAFFSDLVKSRKIPMLMSSILCFVIYSVIIFMPEITIFSMYILFFFSGFFFGGKTLSFASIVENLSYEYSGIAVGFANTVVMLSGVLFLPLVGYLLDFNHPEKAVHDMDSYSLFDFKFALTTIPLSILLAFFLSIKIQETYPHK